MDGINYFVEGWKHIISWNAIDHLLFITALAAIYVLANWRQVLVLITAFTIGHATTLFLSSLNVIHVKSHLIEISIACTILLTATFNFFQKNYNAKTLRFNYFLAVTFGLVHGLGYANAIRFELPKGESILLPLLQFNLGLEAGQILTVTLILLASYLFISLFKLKRNWWVWGLSAIAFLVALKILIQLITNNN